eukprot:3258523-Pleurochrysis_carterae.AAC.1
MSTRGFLLAPAAAAAAAAVAAAMGALDLCLMQWTAARKADEMMSLGARAQSATTHASFVETTVQDKLSWQQHLITYVCLIL